MEIYRELETDYEIKLFSDPYRLKIIEIYSVHKKPMTVKEVADYLHETPSKVHYHVQKLISIRVLELDHTKLINGITAKYYRLTAKNFLVRNLADNVMNLKRNSNILTSSVVLIDEYKKEVIEIGKQTIEIGQQGEELSLKGFLFKETLYMDDEQLENFMRDLTSLFVKHEIRESVKQSQYQFLTANFKKANDGLNNNY